MITWDNYEEYIMMQVDGELSPAEEQELNSFLEQHPALKAEQAAYALTRVSADESVVYTNKESLIKQVPAKRIAFPHWQRYSIAAGVAALICISVLRLMNRTDNNATIVALADTAKPAAIHSQNAVATVPDTLNTVVPAQAPVREQADINAGKKATAIKNAAWHKVPVAIPQTDKKNHNVTEPAMIVLSRPEPINIEAITLPAPKKLPVTTATTVPELLNIPSDEPVAIADKHRSFIDRLPLDEANKEQAKKIGKTLGSAYAGIRGISVHIDQESIAINF